MRATQQRFQFLALVMIVGCGGTATTNDAGSSGGSSSSSGGSTAGLPVSQPCPDGCENEAELNRPIPGRRGSCPVQEPSFGENCHGHEGLLCTYGESPRVTCRSRFVCREGQWQEPEALFGQCEEAEDGFCPEERPVQSAECVVSSAGPAMVCGYQNNVVCACYGRVLADSPGDRGQWACSGPPADGRCPAAIPNLGEGCETQALQCRYEPSVCHGGTYDTVFCFNGEWKLGEEAGCDL